MVLAVYLQLLLPEIQLVTLLTDRRLHLH